jgi:uncharacterized protein (DUF1330 family)
MSAYAVAHIQSITVGPPIIEYLELIDATLTPYRGRFLIHGDPADVREGDFAGNLIVIEFPGQDAAVGWYDSAAYTERFSRGEPAAAMAGSSSSTAFPPIIVPPTSSAPAPRPPQPIAATANQRATFLPLDASTCHLDIDYLDMGHRGFPGLLDARPNKLVRAPCFASPDEVIVAPT